MPRDPKENTKRVDILGWTSGLVTKSSPEDLKPNQVQEAINVEFTTDPGAAITRRGLTRWSSSGFTGNVDMFYSTVLDDNNLIIRAGTVLYKGETIIRYNLTDATLTMTEFDEWIIMANGTEVLKYKDAGMGLDWHGAYTFPWEYEYLPDDAKAVAHPYYRVEEEEEMWCTFAWEVGIESGEVTEGEGDFYPESGGDDGWSDSALLYRTDSFARLGHALGFLRTSANNIFRTTDGNRIIVQG